jgi:hypothetical protein
MSLVFTSQGSSSEVMILRTARRYDLETDTVVFAGGTPFTRDSMRYAGLGSYADSLFTFCKGMATLGVDNAEYALLTSLCIVGGWSLLPPARGLVYFNNQTFGLNCACGS